MEKVKMGNLEVRLPVVFFPKDVKKTVTFRFDKGKTPSGEDMNYGEWAVYFPGEEDLAGKDVNEQLRSGVMETFIHDVDSDSKMILSLSGDAAPAKIGEAIKKRKLDPDKSEEVSGLIIALTRTGPQGWKVEIKDQSKLEKTIKDSLTKLKGESFERLDELALHIGIENDLEDITEIEGILSQLKGSFFSLSKQGIRINKQKTKKEE